MIDRFSDHAPRPVEHRREGLIGVMLPQPNQISARALSFRVIGIATLALESSRRRPGLNKIVRAFLHVAGKNRIAQQTKR